MVAYFGVDIQELYDDQCRECNRDDVGEGLFEEHYCGQHYNASLENALPEPDQESFRRERSALLQSLVQRRELHDSLNWNVLIEN
jgi:hypothetical protein